MTAPVGLPKLLDKRRRRELEDVLGTTSAQDQDEPDFPVIPSTSLRRPLNLDEIADAEVVARPQPNFGQRVLSGLEAVGRSGVFDPQSEDFLESTLGSAFGTFAAVRGGRRAQAGEEQDLENAIIEQALEKRQEERQARIDELLDMADLEATRALTGQRRAQATKLRRPEKADADVDVTALAQDLRAQGHGAMAKFVEANPQLVKKSPAAFMRLIEEDEEEEGPTDLQERSLERADRADLRAADQILREIKGGDYGTRERLSTPEGRVERLGELRRLYDPTFRQDSIIRSQFQEEEPEETPDEILGLEPAVRDRLSEAIRTFTAARGGAGPRSDVSPRAEAARTARAPGGEQAAPAKKEEKLTGGKLDPELQAIADDLNPQRIPLEIALEALQETDPPLSPDELRQVLLAAGYPEKDVAKILG